MVADCCQNLQAPWPNHRLFYLLVLGGCMLQIGGRSAHERAVAWFRWLQRLGFMLLHPGGKEFCSLGFRIVINMKNGLE